MSPSVDHSSHKVSAVLVRASECSVASNHLGSRLQGSKEVAAIIMVTYMFGRFSVQTCSCNAFLNVAKAASVSDSGPLFRICFERKLGHLAERVG